MKKCPNCQKEFPDSMRFCQTDGTPLLGAVGDVQAEDPLKTTVVRQDEIASSIPPTDPFKTMVASPERKEDSGDLLQLPEEFDPLKTIVAAPIVAPYKPILEEPVPAPLKLEPIREEIQAETPSSPFSGFSQPSEPLPEPAPDYPSAPPILEPEPPKFEAIKEEIQAETPSSPFSGFSQPSEPLPEPATDFPNAPPILEAELPKFSEPSLSPPDLGNLSATDDADSDLAATMIQQSWDAGKPPVSDSTPLQGASSFSKPTDGPLPSPFDAPPVNEPQSPFGQTPQSPFEAPKSPFDAPQPFGQPQQTPFETPKPSFEEPPPTQFGMPQAPFNQINEPSFGNQPLQQNDWTPPPTPVAGWQDQGLGANTPFQPPMAMQGQNQTLPIVSLVLGIISLCCYIGWATGPAALITGYLGMKNCNNDPNQYGGKGLAIAGMVVGGIFTVLWLLYWILIILVYAGLIASFGLSQ